MTAYEELREKMAKYLEAVYGIRATHRSKIDFLKRADEVLSIIAEKNSCQQKGSRELPPFPEFRDKEGGIDG